MYVDRENSRTIEPAFRRVCIVLGESNSLVRSYVSLLVPPVIGVRLQAQCFGSAHRRNLVHGHYIIIVINGGGVEHCKGKRLYKIDYKSPETTHH